MIPFLVIALRMVLAILLGTMGDLLPTRGPADLGYRIELAEAAASVTDDLQEQLLLVAIPRWESSYRRDVGECRRKGPQGELGAWQILPRSDGERRSLCASLAGDARVALARIRESLKTCAALPAEERLAVYTRGSCSSVDGRRLSRVRWVSAPTKGPAR
jgi:hypothetical protein